MCAPLVIVSSVSKDPQNRALGVGLEKKHATRKAHEEDTADDAEGKSRVRSCEILVVSFDSTDSAKRSVSEIGGESDAPLLIPSDRLFNVERNEGTNLERPPHARRTRTRSLSSQSTN